LPPKNAFELFSLFAPPPSQDGLRNSLDLIYITPSVSLPCLLGFLGLGLFSRYGQ